MNIEIRPVKPHETQAFRSAIARGFGGDSREADHDRFYETLPLHRTVAAFDDGVIVGTLGEFDFDVTVPGGAQVPMAGTTVVTVRPTHRRMGILRKMMQRHLDTVAERGDPLAGLWASETAIYGRFGFGVCADRHSIDIDARKVALPPGPAEVRVDMVEGDEAKTIIPGLYAVLRTCRAGSLSRSDAWWEHRRFYDPEHYREGASARRYAVARRQGVPVGYVMYRQKEKWDDFVPDGSINVIEVFAEDEDARRALWSFLTNVDLFPNVNWWNAPIDEPMVWEASDQRQIRRKIIDTLWLRIMDVKAALEARSYESDGGLVLDVRDAQGEYTGGRFELTVDAGAGACRTTSSEAAIALDIEVLGALYMGGRSAHNLWRAGRIEGAEADVRRLDRIFRTVVPPWCPEVF